MFDKQQNSLLEGTTTAQSNGNKFVEAGNKKSAETRSGNNALKYTTTGNDFVDQFGLAGTYKKPRKYDEVATDMAKLWENPMKALAFIIYLRLITRTVQLFNGNKTTTTQRGAGMRHEGMLRMIWLHINHPDVFWKNIPLFIAVGSWRDIIQMLAWDLKYNGWKGRVLDWDKFKGLIKAGLENPSHSQLLIKYLPTIKATKQLKTLEKQADTMIGKWICSFLFGDKESSQNYKKYRQMKSSGTAHQWQQLIAQKRMNEINFNTIHGRALAQLVSSKFLANQGLEKKYEEWISKQPVAKFTGFLPELLLKPVNKQYQIQTFNKQFQGVVETAKKGAVQNTKFIAVVDTSGSMSAINSGIAIANMSVAKILALFCSQLLDKGPFKGSWYNFGETARLEKISGTTPWEQWKDMESKNLCCSTNFQAVVDHMISIKRQGVPEEDFPTGLLVFSDGEFNESSGRTNSAEAIRKLKLHFSSEFVDNFKFVFWMLQSNYYGKDTGKKFESHGGMKNYFYFGGYDGAIVAFLTGLEGKERKVETASDVIEVALTQEVMQFIEL